MSVGATYRDRKLHGIDANLCTYPGCRKAPADDSDYCVGHRDSERERKKAWARKQRKKAAGKKLCTRCFRRRRARGSSWGCSRCLVELGKIPRRSKFVATHVDKTARIAALTVRGMDGRTRFHGRGKRGMPPVIIDDTTDLNEAMRRIDRALRGLQYAKSDEVQALPRVQRKEVELEALSHADHGARFIESVLERHRYDGRMPPKDNKDGD